jgi:hypothetical protein
MRAMMFLTVLIVTGCARPGFNYDRAQGAPLTITAPQNPSYIEAQRLASARNLNLHIVTKDGERLYCRSNLVSGSHIVRDTTCYTAEQVDQMEQRTARQLQLLLRPPLTGQHP